MISASLARLGIVLLSLLLLWRIVFVNAVLYEDSGTPRLATTPRTLEPPAKGAELAALRQVLADNPAEVAALLLLAREFEVASNANLAASAYRSALDIAPFERDVLVSAAAFFLRRGEPEGAELVGRLVANHPQARDPGFATLAQMIAADAHRPAVVRILERHPEWEGAFLVHACRAGVDPVILAPFLAARARAGKDVSTESGCAIERLRKDSRWAQAYQLWLNLLPRNRLANVGHVFNGGFEEPLNALGFDWALSQGAERDTGHAADIRRVQGGSGKLALRIAYNGKRQMGVPALQYLAVAPGRYELSGLARPEALKSIRGIQWTVRCIQEGRPGQVLGHSERFLGSSEWRAFSAEVEVSPACPAQVLQIEPAIDEGSLVFISGTAWFDELRLRRR